MMQNFNQNAQNTGVKSNTAPTYAGGQGGSLLRNVSIRDNAAASKHSRNRSRGENLLAPIENTVPEEEGGKGGRESNQGQAAGLRDRSSAPGENGGPPSTLTTPRAGQLKPLGPTNRKGSLPDKLITAKTGSRRNMSNLTTRFADSGSPDPGRNTSPVSILPDAHPASSSALPLLYTLTLLLLSLFYPCSHITGPLCRGRQW